MKTNNELKNYIYDKAIPDSCGIYLFKNGLNEIIYIGKAKSLYKRVRSYFAKKYKDWKADLLLADCQDIDYIITKSELEALLLEAHLIQTYQPKYNVLLKDGQPFLYIFFSHFDQRLPDSLPVMELVRNKEKDGTYVGPFFHKSATRHAFRFLQETFRLSLCNKNIVHGCLDYHIGMCAGNCKKEFDIAAYITRLQLAYQTLQGNKAQFQQTIDLSIQKYSALLAFETCKYLLAYKKDMDGLFEAVKTKFSPDTFEERLLTRFLPSYAKSSNVDVATQLQLFLRTSEPIHTIDCFDISHFQSSVLVGSCVRFGDGIPDKKKFRKFAIKSLTIQNDCAALQEIVTRRYRKGDLPDLIVIDGGKGQLRAIEQLGLSTKVIALAKPDGSQENRIFFPGIKDAISLDMHRETGKLLIALRDYTHRCAILYHRKKRDKHMGGIS